jgi:hypothetical protein
MAIKPIISFPNLMKVRQKISFGNLTEEGLKPPIRLEGNAIGRIMKADLECNHSDGFPYARLLDTKGTWEYDYTKAIAAADLVNRRSLIMGHGVEATPLTDFFRIDSSTAASIAV